MPKPDRRIERTRNALRGAFNQLFYERGYAQITIADIVECANVGRSTFYEHYKSKEEMLTEGVRGMFGELAAIVDTDANLVNLNGLLDHFWFARSRSRNLQNPAVRRAMVRILAQMLRERLHARARQTGVKTSTVQEQLGTHTLAEAMFGTIAAWLVGEIAGDSATLTNVLHRIAQSAAQCLIQTD